MYTGALIAEMRKIGHFTYESASLFALKNNLSLRSVIGKVRALGLDYTPKTIETASKRSTRSKAEIVESIQSAINSPLSSLSKMTVNDLEVLEKFLSVNA